MKIKKEISEPTDGITKCDCGSKYWDQNYLEKTWRCHSCDWPYHERMKDN